jgi:AraC-like DNA-binding protein
VLDVRIGFVPGTRVGVDVQAITRTNLHAHPDALEIVYVLRGTLRTRVSSETFDLDAGDYAVLNRADPHVHDGSIDNVTAVLHFDLGAFRDVDSFADSIMFACESFDLPRYRRQEALLRGLLLDAVAARGTAQSDTAAVDLIRALCTGYTLADYYQRDRTLTVAQRERFLTLMAYIQDHVDSRELLDDVAREHHYSKSYVSHFMKDTAALSFTSAANAARVMRAERLLLTTDHTMRDISARCGFSDVKYFTRCFVDWFTQTPAEYRTANRPALHRDNDIQPVPDDVTADLIREHRRRVASPTDTPRLSITPILLKNVGSRADLFEKLTTFPTDRGGPVGGPDSGHRPHLLPLRIGQAEVDNGVLLSGLASFSDAGVTPCLVVEFAGRESTAALLDAVSVALEDGGMSGVPIWLVYSGGHARAVVDHLANDAHTRHGLDIQPVLVG